MDAREIHRSELAALQGEISTHLARIAAEIREIVASYGEGPIPSDQYMLIMGKIDAALDTLYPPTPASTSLLEGAIVQSTVQVRRRVQAGFVEQVIAALDRKDPP